MRFILALATLAAVLFLADWDATTAQAADPRTASYCYWEYHYYPYCCDYFGNWTYIVTWTWVCR